MLKKVLFTISCIFLAYQASASHAIVSLEELVSGAQVIIVGEITEVKETPHSTKKRHQYDIAFIKTSKVIKNITELNIVEGQKTPLSMPAKSNSSGLSSDLYYEKGAKGVWLLTFKNGEYLIKHPDSLQKRHYAKAISRMVDK